jgi:DNA invertase Pin-like site-specific DNA recombinase
MAENVSMIGYTRVSKADGSQVHHLQHDALVAAGVDPKRIYKDSISGTRDSRPGLDACLAALAPGDTLVIWKLDRLGRSLRHLVNTVGELTARGIGLKVLTGEGAMIDTTTASGRLMFGIFAALAEFERELIVERTRAGIAAARARGQHCGRRPKLNPNEIRLLHKAMGDRRKRVIDVIKEFGISRATAYRYIGPKGELREFGKRALKMQREGRGKRS